MSNRVRNILAVTCLLVLVSVLCVPYQDASGNFLGFGFVFSPSQLEVYDSQGTPFDARIDTQRLVLQLAAIIAAGLAAALLVLPTPLVARQPDAAGSPRRLGEANVRALKRFALGSAGFIAGVFVIALWRQFLNPHGPGAVGAAIAVGLFFGAAALARKRWPP